jgi:hypothetical protein
MDKSAQLTSSDQTGERSGRESSRFIPTPTEPPSHVQAVIAIVIQACVVILLAILVWIKVYIKKPGNLSNDSRILYVTGITILATLVSSNTSGQIRRLWVRRYLSSAEDDENLEWKRAWAATVVGLSSLLDSIKCWPVSVSFLISGLITTAIVAGLSPTVSPGNLITFASFCLPKHCYILTPLTVIIPTEAEIFPSGYTDGLEACLLTSKGNDSSDWFNWQLSDGSNIAINTTSNPYCATQMVLPIMSDSLLQTEYEWGFSYTMGGVPIQNAAVGVAFSPFYGFIGTFGNGGLLLGDGPDFLWSVQCLPTMTQNPVQCRAIGNVTIGTSELTVDAANCSITSPIYSVDPNTQGASVAGACTNGLEVGTATIVMGSVNRHASMLASAMNDTSFDRSRKSYVVACSVNIGPSLSYRQLNYSQASASDWGGYNGPAFKVTGDSTSGCQPTLGLQAILTNTTLASAAAGSWQLLSENRYLDGWWSTLYYYTTILGQRNLGEDNQYIFNNSRNALEDALGLSSGIAFGTFLATKTPESIDGQVTIYGKTVISGIRIGSGKWWAIFYILPSLFSIIVLVVLLLQSR